MSTKQLYILIIEDNFADVGLVQRALEKEFFFVLNHAVNLQDALSFLKENQPDIILLDLDLPDSLGIETFIKLYQHASQTPIVVFSRFEDKDMAEQVLKKGAQDVVVKDEMTSLELTRIIHYAIERHELRTELTDKLTEIEDSEARFRHILQNNMDGILVLDNEGVVQFANPAAEYLLDRSLENLVGEVFGFPVEGKENLELTPIRKDGQHIEVEMRVTQTQWEGELAYIAALRDITELKEAASLKTLIELAGAAAHEINQPLTVVLGHTELAKREINPAHTLYPHLDSIHTAADHINKIVKQLQSVKKYSTKQYIGDIRIIDLDESNE